jgi:hypothetical protein
MPIDVMLFLLADHATAKGCPEIERRVNPLLPPGTKAPKLIFVLDLDG